MLTRLWMYAELRNLRTEMNKTCQESMFIRYPTISKIRGGDQLKDDIPKENHHGNMAEITVTHQRKEVKANQTIQTVLVVDTIILEDRARQKQSTATTVRRWDTLRNNVGIRLKKKEEMFQES